MRGYVVVAENTQFSNSNKLFDYGTISSCIILGEKPLCLISLKVVLRWLFVKLKGVRWRATVEPQIVWGKARDYWVAA